MPSIKEVKMVAVSNQEDAPLQIVSVVLRCSRSAMGDDVAEVNGFSLDPETDEWVRKDTDEVIEAELLRAVGEWSSWRRVTEADFPADRTNRDAWRDANGVISVDETKVVLPYLTARQLRLGLVRNGIPLSTVQAAIDAMPSPQRDEAQIYWEFSTEIHWEHPMTGALMQLIGLDPADAEVMWMAAKDYER